MNTASKDISNKELLEACFRGEGAAATVFYERYKDLIYSAIHKWINKYANAVDRDEDVKEIFNEAVINLMNNNFAKLKQARDLNNVSGLIFIIAYQTAGRYFKKKWVYDRRKKDIPDAGLPDKSPDPIDKLIKEEQIRLVGEFLAALTPLEQNIMEQRYGKGLKYREIAGRLELSTVHVGVVISRVKEKLEEFIRERCGGI